MRYEVFNAVTGRTVCVLPRLWLASLVARVLGGVHDYAPMGEGWVR